MGLRVLTVSPVPSHPSDQGNSARIQTLALELKDRGAKLDFFYYGMEGLNESQRLSMQAFWENFYFRPSEQHARPKYPRYWGIDDWCPDSLCADIHSLHQQVGYDVILVNYVWMSRVLANLKNTIRVIDTHDIFGDRHLVSTREGMEPKWFFTSIAEEDLAFKRADLIIGIQDQETAEIRSRVPGKVITVGHLMSPVFLYQSSKRNTIATFGYIGSGNEWNRKCVSELDAALQLAHELDWAIAGSITRQRLQLKSNPYLMGVVAKLSDFYEKIDCVVNPMIGGTGLKIKTVEALSFGKAVIGTKNAFAGMPVGHEAHKLRDVKECLEAMKAYKSDDAYRTTLDIASRALYFDYMQKVNREFDELWAVLDSQKVLSTSPDGTN